MFIALLPPAACLRITPTGCYLGATISFSPKQFSARSFAANSWDALEQACASGKLRFHGLLQGLAQPKLFRILIRQLFRHRWVVYCKPPFGGPEQVLRYLGAYTHRVAISNHRLVSFLNDQVTFRWRDSAHHNKKRLLTLHVDEFLRRFLRHVLPRGFVRIRHYGFLASRRRGALIPLCKQRLSNAALAPPPLPQAAVAPQSTPLWICPFCGGPMILIERLTCAQIQLRSPPQAKVA